MADVEYVRFGRGLGGLAQLGERGVRNAEVEGSNPLPSTTFLFAQMHSNLLLRWRLVACGGNMERKDDVTRIVILLALLLFANTAGATTLEITVRQHQSSGSS